MHLYKVAAYITAYQDAKALVECIRSLRQQSYPIGEIFIVDNSPTPLIETCKTLDIELDWQAVTVQHCPENVGIAGGLALGVQWAIAAEYDFLWTFDQDSQPAPDALEILVTKYRELSQKENYKIGIIAPLPIDTVTLNPLHGIVHNQLNFTLCQPQPGQDYYECDVVITSGSLVSISAAKNVPLPNKDFFIDVVDYEYCLNFRDRGYKVILVLSSILNHRLGLSTKVYSRLLKKDLYVRNYSPARMYYICRNNTYLETRICDRALLLTSIKWRLRCTQDAIVEVLHEKDQKLLKVWACILGTFDGFIGRLGKNW